MPQIIASLYELLDKIGSGGAGIVYLGKHIRLNKQVVLKADKRTLATKPEVLRREVDALKDLSHTYIPQVFDFVEEDGVVYTVMDYIEGESLDKPLQRGERFPQPQVIEWACELLEALCYLHSRPPHGILHSDIKPANIMRTPQGDIRLIDFNIALALGEEGSVKVGYSRGYASPEHYGIDYSSHPKDSDVTELLDNTTQRHQTGSTPPGSSTGSATSQKHTILLDVRSDVYGAGATLYHLLTGVRPAVDARQVPMIQHPAVSPAVAEIIHKAMEPDPDRRFQTAQEMLAAFEHLHENDPRMVRHRRSVKISAAALSILFLLGGACTFAGLRQREQIQALAAEEARIAEEAERTAKRALASTTASEAAWENGNVAEAVRLAREALSLHTVYDARAQAALTNALGVYDLSGGYRAHTLLELPAEPTQALLSPEGTRFGAMAGGQLLVFDTESGTQIAALPAENSALSQLAFVNEDVVIFAGDGALRAYDLAGQQELWSGAAATAIALSADGSTVAAAYKDDSSAVIYDVASGMVKQTVDFQGNRLFALYNDNLADTNIDLFALNHDGTLLAVGFADGGALRVCNLGDRNQDIIVYEQSEFKNYGGGFNNQYLAFLGWDGEAFSFATIDTVELMQCYGISDRMKFLVQVGENGLFFAAGRLLVQMDPATGMTAEMAYCDNYINGMTVGSDGKSVVRTEDGQMYVFGNNQKILTALGERGSTGFQGIAGDYVFSTTLNEQAVRVWKLDEKPESLLFSFDNSAYDYLEARVSGDGKTMMLFRYDRFWLLDKDGNLLQEVEIPIPQGDQVYDQQFIRDADGSRLEVTYYSGLVRNYSAANGSLLSEEQGTPHDDSLAETFYTDSLRIERPLHGTPLVYDRATGDLLGELEQDDYLTYVTQVGEYMITEYLSTTKARYGLLLNKDLEVVGRMPGLCDIMEDGRLIFDDGAGHLRQSRLYTAEELLALAGTAGS